jgi:glycerophosphoryl diester phosphodiesterase
MKISCIIGVLLILVGCQEALENRYELSLPNETIFLGHKGSGTQGEFGNSYPDNSISGILHAIEALDGAEFDLQLSVDSTLWLFHDHVMLNCSGDLVNIASISDSSIEANSVCNYASKIARFCNSGLSCIKWARVRDFIW